ncbi:TetR/AcrR family transcriptional regulator [Streptomyces sp. NPDC059534]|uniref:TetR/AcrR family transcriptional regulator n=1 Tax=Streptomyces sp. NPDC059534 TaxID=3346859 RepID=UPI0036CB7DA5
METLREKYAENTRRALLATGLRLFTERDYASVSAEELVRTAGLTRGALYHHFGGKPGLFEAVFEELERQATKRIRVAITPVPDPRGRAYRAVDAFLDVCAEHAYRHIVLQQGPIALGWQRWRELDQLHLGGLVLDIVNAALNAGRLRPHPANLVAIALYGALTELSITVAETEEPDQAQMQAADLIRNLIDGVVTDSGPPSA